MYYSKLHLSYHILPLAKLVYDFESCRNLDTIEDVCCGQLNREQNASHLAPCFQSKLSFKKWGSNHLRCWKRTEKAIFFLSSFPTSTIVNHIIKGRNKNQPGKEREMTHGYKEYRVCSQAEVRAGCRARPSCAAHTPALPREGNAVVTGALLARWEGRNLLYTEFSSHLQSEMLFLLAHTLQELGADAWDALTDTLIARSWVSWSSLQRNTGTSGALDSPGWAQLLKDMGKQKLPFANLEQISWNSPQKAPLTINPCYAQSVLLRCDLFCILYFVKQAVSSTQQVQENCSL